MNLRRTITGCVMAILFATVMTFGFFLQVFFPPSCLYAGTMESLTKAAGKGDSVACFHIGLMYDRGSGVGKNREEAEKWFKEGEDLIDPLRLDIIRLAIGETKELPKDRSDAVNRYRLKAEKGDTALQLLLGSLYTIPQVQDEAVKWYRLAAEGNCAYAQFIVAQLLDQEDEKIVWYQRAGENGYVNAYGEIGDIQRGKKNYAEMLTWYRTAAERGDVRTQERLGDILKEGKIVPKDMAEAVRYYKLAADKGSMTAIKTLAVIYEKGEGVPKDAVEAIRWYGKLAEQDGEYGVRIAKFYHAGKDVPRDMAEALRWYRFATEKGEASAFESLIALYESGKDMPRDMAEALKWHVKLAEMDPDHYVRVADIYRFGEGVPADIKKALAYYQMALKKSEGSGALEALGDLYSEGKDIAKDIPQALNWYGKAAEKGNADAAFKLAGILEMEKLNRTEIDKWFRRAAVLGSDKAQTRVGLTYLSGDGASPDYRQAGQWLRKAANANNKTAVEKLAALYRNGLGAPLAMKEAADKWRKENNIDLSHNPERALIKGSMIVQQYGYPVARETRAALKKQQALRAAQIVASNDFLKMQKIPVVSDQKQTVYLDSITSGWLPGEKKLFERYSDDDDAAVCVMKLDLFGAQGLLAMNYDSLFKTKQVTEKLEGRTAYNHADAPAPEESYDGLIIDATDRDFRPAIFNRIFTKGKALLYDPSRSAKEIFLKRGSGGYANTLEDAKQLLAGDGVKNPLIVKAIGTTTITDVMVSDDDAARIFAADKLGSFLFAAKVAYAFTDTLERAAMRGDLKASVQLAEFYLFGDKERRNYERGARWYAHAAEKGHALGQNNLGAMYESGQGVKQDYSTAATWYEKSARRGYAKAQVNLAILYRNGWGVGKDDTEALKWFTEAEKQDYRMQQEETRNRWHIPWGLLQDLEEADRWQGRVKKIVADEQKKK